MNILELANEDEREDALLERKKVREKERFMEVKWWALEHQATLAGSRSTDALWDTGRQTLVQWLGADPESEIIPY